MSLGAFIVRRRTGQHDYSIPDRHFSVRKPPIGRREASCLRESKHFRQPFQGGNAVLIGQIRNHVLHLVLLSPCHEGFEHQTRTMALPSRPCRLTSSVTGRRRYALVSDSAGFAAPVRALVRHAVNVIEGPSQLRYSSKVKLTFDGAIPATGVDSSNEK